MSGKVFISCGQRPPRGKSITDEKSITDKVKKLLKKLKLDYFVAFEMQGVNDIDKIINELRSSDYYLFIDFYRRDDKVWPISLFAHQELALAHHLGFKEIIAFKEKGVPSEGIFKYVVAHPETFENEKELLKKIEEAVKKRNWTRSYSRNLIVQEIFPNPKNPWQYKDDTELSSDYIWHANIKNRRPDVAAVNTVCILDYIEFPNGKQKPCDDRSYLKWAGHQREYQRTILPEDYGILDIFAVRADQTGIYLHSNRDVTPRTPIIAASSGNYRLCYKVFSVGFPLLSFVVHVNYQHSSPNRTRAELVS